MRKNLLFLALAALLPAAALAHGDAYTPDDTTMLGVWDTPTLSEVEDAIDAAAAEFGVPPAILEAIAHTESRWQHRPYRVSQDGRRGLFQMPEGKIDLAAELLAVPVDAVRGDIVQHTRGFAAVLDSERPTPKDDSDLWSIGQWRATIAWALELPESFDDRYVDGLFELIDQGLIDQLPNGEPISIAPAPVEDRYMGAFQPSSERSSDYGPAVWDPTPCNYSNDNRTVGDVDVVIIHTVQGSYGGAISWFHNCSANVSAHYVISTAGAITQVVDEEDVGWHVSCWNSFSIGIEHEGYAEEPEIWYTDAMYAASAALTADILADWGLPADRDHVMGHSEIDPACNSNGHWDPGPGWDWDYYMTLVGGSVTPPDTTALVGYVRHTDLYEAAYGIGGATVTVDGGVGSTTTNGDGYYSFDEITAGDYNICATASGYDEGCRTKTVEGNITNWGSLLLEEATGDDDDATEPPDDDDVTEDDDDATEPPDDDDDTVEDDDDDDDGEATVGGERRSSTPVQRRGCRATVAPSAATGWSTLLLLCGAAAMVRRRRDSR